MCQGLTKAYRASIVEKLHKLGYEADWRLVKASDFGVPQLRPRFILVAMKTDLFSRFNWPAEVVEPPTVGETLIDLMQENGWAGADSWAATANNIAPTVVGGSKKHGEADLGPTRAKASWLKLGVDGKGIADSAPPADAPVDFVPRLTNRMVARIQSFDDSWEFSGRKTSMYRQIGNAFPPPVAASIGTAIRKALT